MGGNSGSRRQVRPFDDCGAAGQAARHDISCSHWVKSTLRYSPSVLDSCLCTCPRRPNDECLPPMQISSDEELASPYKRRYSSHIVALHLLMQFRDDPEASTDSSVSRYD